MATDDRQHWDRRYRQLDGPPSDAALPDDFAPYEAEFPHQGTAIDIACGTGRAACWLAARGMQVIGYDISPVAIDHARALAAHLGLRGRVRFEVADLDDGLPGGGPVDVVLCTMFRAPALDDLILARLKPGALLAMSALSEVGAEPGRFRSTPGELPQRFATLNVIAHGEGDGRAWLLARRHARQALDSVHAQDDE